MLNISGLSEGIVLDHIKAGKSLDIYYQLGLNKLDSQIAIIKNAHSQKMGRKDIIKVEGDVLDRIDLDVLGCQIGERLIAHQHADFFDEVAELVRARCLVAQSRDFMLHQRVLVDKYFAHVRPPVMALQIVLKPEHFQSF